MSVSVGGEARAALIVLDLERYWRGRRMSADCEDEEWTERSTHHTTGRGYVSFGLPCLGRLSSCLLNACKRRTGTTRDVILAANAHMRPKLAFRRQDLCCTYSLDAPLLSASLSIARDTSIPPLQYTLPLFSSIFFAIFFTSGPTNPPTHPPLIHTILHLKAPLIASALARLLFFNFCALSRRQNATRRSLFPG